MNINANFFLSDNEKEELEKLNKCEVIKRKLKEFDIEDVMVKKTGDTFYLLKDIPEVGDKVKVSKPSYFRGIDFKVVEKLERNSYRLKKYNGEDLVDEDGFRVSSILLDKRNIIC